MELKVKKLIYIIWIAASPCSTGIFMRNGKVRQSQFTNTISMKLQLLILIYQFHYRKSMDLNTQQWKTFITYTVANNSYLWIGKLRSKSAIKNYMLKWAPSSKMGLEMLPLSENQLATVSLMVLSKSVLNVRPHVNCRTGRIRLEIIL